MRFSRVTLIGLAAVLLSTISTAQTAKTQAGDWPMYNRDLAGTR
jgi:hypothetical protein